MNKLLSVIVAAMFAAVSVSAFAASHTGAPMKDEKKTEKKKAAPKKEGEAKKAAPKKEGEAKKGAPKKDGEKKKAAAKKDEVKK